MGDSHKGENDKLQPFPTNLNEESCQEMSIAALLLLIQGARDRVPHNHHQTL
jgi:hypothetical protein